MTFGTDIASLQNQIVRYGLLDVQGPLVDVRRSAGILVRIHRRTDQARAGIARTRIACDFLGPGIIDVVVYGLRIGGKKVGSGEIPGHVVNGISGILRIHAARRYTDGRVMDWVPREA